MECATNLTAFHLKPMETSRTSSKMPTALVRPTPLPWSVPGIVGETCITTTSETLSRDLALPGILAEMERCRYEPLMVFSTTASLTTCLGMHAVILHFSQPSLMFSRPMWQRQLRRLYPSPRVRLLPRQ